MKTVIINGVNHKGSTYHIARMLADKIGGESREFFLPRDFGEFCVGCTQCFKDNESKCPHAEKLEPITKAIDEADVIILASPVYVYHATGAMKVFLDHYGYRWMVHRPDERMFHKQGVCIATAAGAGMKPTLKDMADSLFFWGVAKTYRYGLAVHSASWDGVDEARRAKIEKDTGSLARKVLNGAGKVRPGLKTKGFFHIMRMLQKRGWNEADVKYWKERGWDGKNRPW